MNHLRDLLSQLSEHRIGFAEKGVDPASVPRFADAIVKHGEQAMCFSLGTISSAELKAVQPAMGQFRLPYQVTWLEFNPFSEGDSTLAMLASRTSNGRATGVVFLRDLGTWQVISVVTNLDLSACSWDWAGRLNGDNFYEPLVIAAALAACQLVRCLACSNVQAIEHHPSPRLQAARARRGRQPLFSFRTLHLKQRNGTGAQLSQRTDRASPGVHLVRGHVKGNGKGDWIWVDEYVRGNPKGGLRHKDYDASRLPRKPSPGASA